jgi:phosphoribosyl 1,2-cyclic phosphodiesterase
MPRFCVLASGSSGNAAFLQADGFGLLIDIGIGPRLLSSRLSVIGASWKNVNAVLLTHVHSDHWKDRTLAQLRASSIPLYCHPAHIDALSQFGPSFAALHSAGLIRQFEPNQGFSLPRGLECLPVPVPHDSDPTFAFRIDGAPGLFGHAWSLGYAADLGAAPDDLVEAFRDVNVLALEFNHDVEMERRSSRPRPLIERVLSDRGHLSNRQAADSVRRILRISSPCSLRHLVQIHLSRECNRPGLAQSAAKKVIEEHDRQFSLQTAKQDQTSRAIELDPVLSR